jgi:hypothetical protein
MIAARVTGPDRGPRQAVEVKVITPPPRPPVVVRVACGGKREPTVTIEYAKPAKSDE